MTQTNFLQIIPQTRKQKIAMYMKHPKKKLAEFLATRDNLPYPTTFKPKKVRKK